MISPLSLYRFQHPHEVHLKFLTVPERGTADWQKKQLFLRNRVDIQEGIPARKSRVNSDDPVCSILS